MRVESQRRKLNIGIGREKDIRQLCRCWLGKALGWKKRVLRRALKLLVSLQGAKWRSFCASFLRAADLAHGCSVWQCHLTPNPAVTEL